MSPYELDGRAWQESWDRQQEAYLPDREHRIGHLLDAVAAVVGHDTPRLLDLAGGTGSISLRALARFPKAAVTLVDLDPVLLAIAEVSLDDRATIVTADLNDPDWTAALPHREYDAILTATALHWIDGPRLATLYTELHGLLRPGGLFANADQMPDEGLPTLTDRLIAREDALRSARYAAGAVLSWTAWWEHVAADPVLAPLAEKRRQIYPGGHHEDWLPPSTWHLEALRAAGFAETGLLWRGGVDAAVAALR